MGRPLKPDGGSPTFDAVTLRLSAITVVVLAAGMGIWMLLVSAGMPDPAASHWGSSGEADGFAPFASTAWIGFVVTLLTGLLCAFCLSLNSLSYGMRRIGVAFTVVITGFMVGMFMAGIVPQMGAATAVGAHMQWALVGAAVGLSAVLGVLLSLVVPAHAPAMVDADIPEGAHLDPAGARRDDAMKVSIRGTKTLFAVVGGVSLVAIGVLMIVSPWGALGVAVFALLVCSFFAATVTASADGVSVLLWGRWRLVHMPVASFGSATAVQEIQPMLYGGWGYRVNQWGSAYVVRRGPALLLALAGGREFVVNTDTVENAERMAGLLNSYKLLEPHHSGTGRADA